MRFLKFFWAIFILICLQTPLYAALDLELTQGVNAAIPIAIIPFAANGDATQISAIINNDLQNSGQFNIANVQSITQTPHSAQDVDYDYWRKQKMNNLLVGQVTSTFTGYQVNFQLIDVYTGQIIAKQVLSAPTSQLRALAHRISDIVYQQLTGVKGVFSTRIAYVLVQRDAGQPPKFSLMVADEDGFNSKPMLVSAQPIMSPAWSPDGTQIAYVSFEGGSAAVYVQNVGTGQRQVVSHYPGINGAPAWSPDGKSLALVLSTSGYPKIYTLNLTSKQLTQLTHGWSLDTEPSWSPDGKSIIFTSNRGGGPQIYQLTLATGQIQRLTYQGNYNATGSFTADGQYIVVLHEDGNGFNVAMKNLQTGQFQILTNSNYDSSPRLAPNGKMVLFASRYGGNGVLAMVSSDGSVKLRLPANEGDVQEPAWSPYL